MADEAKIVTEKFLDVDGNNVRFLEFGEHHSDTIVFIHGLGASAERWNHVVPIFSKKYRLLVPDLVGFGYSDKPLVDYTPDFFAKFLKNFMDSSDVKNPFLVGSSLGGQVVSEFAASNPGAIKKLILVSPAGVMKQSTPALDAYIMAALYPNEQSAKNAFELMEGSGEPIDPQITNEFVKRMQMPNSKMAFMSTVLGLKNSDSIEPKLKNISVPTLLVWGSADPVIPIKHAESFSSSIPNCQFHQMDGCGHTPYVQKPLVFANKVLDFIREK